MFTKYVFAISVLLLNLIPASVLAIDEGLYTDGVRFLSIKKRENLVKFLLIKLDAMEWQTFSGLEDADGNVVVYDHWDGTSVEWIITSSTKGVNASRVICLGEDCDGPVIMQYSLFLPDTGGSLSGIYQSLGFQNLIIHQVGNKALSIDLYSDIGSSYTGEDFEVIKWERQDDNTWRPRNTIFSTFVGDDDDPFEGDIVVTTSGTDNEKLNVSIENCVITEDIGLDCDGIEYALSGRRVF